MMEQILSAFHVVSGRSFSCAGKTVDTRGDSLVTSLQDCLYRLCYARRFAGTFQAATPSREADPGLLEALQAANASRTIYESGWWIEQTHESGKILASRDGITRWFLPGHFLTDVGLGSVAPKDAPVTIRILRDSTTEQAGFYRVFGETINHREEFLHLLRFYWNVTLAGAPLLMSLLTRELNRFQVPYLFKCGDRPEMYERIDAAVLYVDRRYYGITARILASIYPRLAHVLDSATPIFTRRLADGLGFAEDPSEGKSFGLSRCTILAETLRACYEQNLTPVEQRLAELEKQFHNRGIDPKRPYLNPGSRDTYEFPALA